jgi:tetratricopeptide (TPR) repeat protein
MKTEKKPAKRDGEKKSFSEKLSDFLRANRVTLFVILGAVLVAVASVAIVSGVKSSQANASSSRIDALSADLSTWSSEQDAAKKAELEKLLVSNLTEVTTKWPRQFAAARAYSLLARIAEQNKDWTSAEKDWMAVADKFSSTYLAPIALQNAAVAAEERGANDIAIAHYKAFTEKYKGKSVGLPHAYFSMGRLAEDSKDYASALTSYEKLVSTYPDDDWTKLAKDRIIFLKASGFGK